MTEMNNGKTDTTKTAERTIREQTCYNRIRALKASIPIIPQRSTQKVNPKKSFAL
jgi:hypothetical protein